MIWTDSIGDSRTVGGDRLPGGDRGAGGQTQARLCAGARGVPHGAAPAVREPTAPPIAGARITPSLVSRGSIGIISIARWRGWARNCRKRSRTVAQPSAACCGTGSSGPVAHDQPRRSKSAQSSSSAQTRRFAPICESSVSYGTLGHQRFRSSKSYHAALSSL